MFLLDTNVISEIRKIHKGTANKMWRIGLSVKIETLYF